MKSHRIYIYNSNSKLRAFRAYWNLSLHNFLIETCEFFYLRFVKITSVVVHFEKCWALSKGHGLLSHEKLYTDVLSYSVFESWWDLTIICVTKHYISLTIGWPPSHVCVRPLSICFSHIGKEVSISNSELYYFAFDQ